MLLYLSRLDDQVVEHQVCEFIDQAHNVLHGLDTLCRMLEKMFVMKTMSNYRLYSKKDNVVPLVAAQA